MSNPYKGEVEFTADKKAYKLHYNINAMCELEDALGDSVISIANLMSDPMRISVKTMRTMFWAGLRGNHGDITLVEAGDIMSAVGITESMALIARAFMMSFPEAETSRPLPGTTAPESIGRAH
jgi:tail tube GTA-gp10-like protein